MDQPSGLANSPIYPPRMKSLTRAAVSVRQAGQHVEGIRLNSLVVAYALPREQETGHESGESSLKTGETISGSSPHRPTRTTRRNSKSVEEFTLISAPLHEVGSETGEPSYRPVGNSISFPPANLHPSTNSLPIANSHNEQRPPNFSIGQTRRANWSAAEGSYRFYDLNNANENPMEAEMPNRIKKSIQDFGQDTGEIHPVAIALPVSCHLRTNSTPTEGSNHPPIPHAEPVRSREVFNRHVWRIRQSAPPRVILKLALPQGKPDLILLRSCLMS
ncbi:hypothetical protein R1flu_024632 [Riccia fluitans]|uniref:Uncharacterized protein n=1 Tax=Riccia fluitans TaxID=41844 RepID=A0ABD1XVV0_9MARC